jgi:hypothetical protein
MNKILNFLYNNDNILQNALLPPVITLNLRILSKKESENA